MITREEETYFLDHARVPEHVVSLMAILSDGEPFLVNGYLCFQKENGLIFVGYAPVGNNGIGVDEALEEALGRLVPRQVWFIGERAVAPREYACTERHSDEYLRLSLPAEETRAGEEAEAVMGRWAIPRDLQRPIRRAADVLIVERGRSLSTEHEAMVEEFLARRKPSATVVELYRKLPDYFRRSATALLLSALDRRNRLTAFFVLEMAASEFSVFLAGAHSKVHYIPHASDLLFREMAVLSMERGKRYIHLGLGVSEGIRRFKEKWGGRPFLPYELCAFTRLSSPTSRFLGALGGRS